MDLIDYSFIRYLSAKSTVDDRALNRYVWHTLAENLPGVSPGEPFRILEIGCGIGTMLTRMLDWGLVGGAEVTAIDALPDNIAAASHYLIEWGKTHNYHVQSTTSGVELTRQVHKIKIRLEAVDLFDFIRHQSGQQTWDLLVAHAFLDLLDIPTALPQILRLARPGGLFYFSLNFDGVTILEPAIEPSFDELVVKLYHRTMDERITSGRPSGDSQTGRRLFAHLNSVGANLLAAGASDWVVYPVAQGYPADEAYFLHFIINTIAGALTDHPDLDPVRFQEWIAVRHAQVERSELVYVAHQLDFIGKWDE
jgi:SAM-dependent methyltransferase